MSFDKAVAAESVGLYGEYDGYNQHFGQGYKFPPEGLDAEEAVQLLELAGLTGVTYNDLVNSVGAFICGVANLSDENIGTTIKVELIIWDPNDENAEPSVIETTEYTFCRQPGHCDP